VTGFASWDTPPGHTARPDDFLLDILGNYLENKSVIGDFDHDVSNYADVGAISALYPDLRCYGSSRIRHHEEPEDGFNRGWAGLERG
jgi:hypothetical protein